MLAIAPSAGRSVQEILLDTAERLSSGRTPPADWYTDAGVYEWERERIFARTWQLVASTSQIPRPGDYLVTSVDERREFIVVRGEDGAVRGFHNVCPHRGNRIAAEGGHANRSLMCGYHGWTYALDGQLRAARGLELDPSFDRCLFGLMAVPTEVVEPFIFLNPEPSAGPLSDHLGSWTTEVSRLELDMAGVARSAHVEVVDSVLECNWKIAVENSLECYHCPTSHPGLGATFDMNRWHIAMSDRCIIQGTGIRPIDAPASGRAAELRMGSAATAAALEPGGIDHAVFFYVFPNNSVSLWPGPGNSFNCARWIPLGPERTRWWSMRWWPSDADQVALKEQWDFMLRIGWEDKAIVEDLQRGVASGAWRGGVFDVRDERSGEHGVQRFDTLVTEQALAQI